MPRQAMKVRGPAVTGDGHMRLMLRLPHRLGVQLQDIADREGNGVNSVARRLLSKALKQEDRGGHHVE